MKLSFDLKEAERAALEKSRKALQKLVKIPETHTKSIESLRGVEASVLAAIEKLEAESEDGANEGVVTKLCAKQEQLKRLRHSIDRKESELSGDLDEFLTNAKDVLFEANRGVSGIFRKIVEGHLRELGALIEPYCLSTDHAAEMVQRFIPAHQYVAAQFAMPPGTALTSIDRVMYEARRFLGYMEAILSGGEILPEFSAVRDQRAGRKAA
jgi:hypothetical protein